MPGPGSRPRRRLTVATGSETRRETRPIIPLRRRRTRRCAVGRHVVSTATSTTADLGSARPRGSTADTSVIWRRRSSDSGASRSAAWSRSSATTTTGPGARTASALAAAGASDAPGRGRRGSRAPRDTRPRAARRRTGHRTAARRPHGARRGRTNPVGRAWPGSHPPARPGRRATSAPSDSGSGPRISVTPPESVATTASPSRGPRRPPPRTSRAGSRGRRRSPGPSRRPPLPGPASTRTTRRRRSRAPARAAPAALFVGVRGPADEPEADRWRGAWARAVARSSVSMPFDLPVADEQQLVRPPLRERDDQEVRRRGTAFGRTLDPVGVLPAGRSAARRRASC